MSFETLSRSALRDVPVSFPGLFGDWQFTVPSKAIDFGNGVYWYGICIAVGMLVALWYCMKRAPRYGLTEDNVIDAVLWVLPIGVLGARLYYIIFYFDLFRHADGSPDWGAMVRIWDGGLAIYGGVLAGVLTGIVFCRVKKLRVWALIDCLMPGLLIGQIFGRWGNFFNREAFGGLAELPWRMRLWVSDTVYFDVHPTFLYESLWNLAGLLLMVCLVAKARRFDGENTCFYCLWYGLGRLWIEGLRTDSLYLFDWTLFGAPIRVSQALSVVLIVGAAAVLLYRRRHPGAPTLADELAAPQEAPAQTE